MSSNFKVEDNIPITKKAVARNRSPLREAIAGLEIGQCVTVYPEHGQTLKQLRGRLSGLTQGAKEDNPGAAYIHRTVDTEEGTAVRIWRVRPKDAPAPVARKKAASKKKSSSKKEEPAAPPQHDGFPELPPEDSTPADPPPDNKSDDDDDPFDGDLDEEDEDQTCSNCGMDLNLNGQCDNPDCEESEEYEDPFRDED